MVVRKIFGSRLLTLAAFAALIALVLDGRAKAELFGRQEVALRALAAHSEQRAVAAEAHSDDLARDLLRIEHDLDAALNNSHAISEAMAAQFESLQRTSVQRESAAAFAQVPMPSGVARCITLLRECLVADGFAELRFLNARECAESELRGVEVLDVDASGGTELIVAARMTVTLDRAEGTLALRFYDGMRRALGLRIELPPEGHERRFRPVTGPMFESKLPFLLRVIGEYPVQTAAALPAMTSTIDVATKRDWILRVDELLAEAGTELHLHLADFQDLDGGVFGRVRLAGYEQDKRLAMTADCSELSFEVDVQSGIVSLLLRSGTLHGKGGESTIAKDGFRMLLPKINPKAASLALLGMVVQR